MEIKDILKNRRIELGLTLLQVAKAVGVSEATVSRWESGEIANMKRSRIAALAKILQISPATIMGWEDEAAKSENSPDESFYDYYTKVRKSKGAVMFRGGDSDSDPFYMSAEEAADAEAYIRTRRKMQEEQGK